MNIPKATVFVGITAIERKLTPELDAISLGLYQLEGKKGEIYRHVKRTGRDGQCDKGHVVAERTDASFMELVRDKEAEKLCRSILETGSEKKAEPDMPLYPMEEIEGSEQFLNEGAEITGLSRDTVGDNSKSSKILPHDKEGHRPRGLPPQTSEEAFAIARG